MGNKNCINDLLGRLVRQIAGSLQSPPNSASMSPVSGCRWLSSSSPHPCESSSMAVFTSQPLQPNAVKSTARRRPFLLFGLPFITILVVGSFALSGVTQTRYDLRNSKVQALSKEDELKMNKNRKKVDIREEYYRLKAKDTETKNLDDWENKRIARLPGQAEWGQLPAKSSKA